jgi:hypothetical protein
MSRWLHGEARIALRNETQWKPTHKYGGRVGLWLS